MRFRAVIFDLDGTLVDSESIAMEAGTRAAQRFGVTMRQEFFVSLIGSDFATSQARLTEEFGADLMDPLNAAWEAEYKALRAKGLPLKPGVIEVLDAVLGHSVPQAVCTSSRRTSATASLTATGILERFDSIVTRDCVTQAKPHPEPYLTAADRLGVAPEACLAFEDSATGARAAQAAGMTVVVVPDLAPVPDEIGHHRGESLMHGAELAGLL